MPLVNVFGEVGFRFDDRRWSFRDMFEFTLREELVSPCRPQSGCSPLIAAALRHGVLVHAPPYSHQMLHTRRSTPARLRVSMKRKHPAATRSSSSCVPRRGPPRGPSPPPRTSPSNLADSHEIRSGYSSCHFPRIWPNFRSFRSFWQWDELNIRQCSFPER